MKEASKPERTLGIYLVILFMVLSILSSVTMLVTATKLFLNPVDVVVLIITIIPIVGLWLMKKWGTALTAVLTCMGIAINIINLQLVYFNLLPEEFEFLVESYYWPIVMGYAIALVIEAVLLSMSSNASSQIDSGEKPSKTGKLVQRLYF